MWANEPGVCALLIFKKGKEKEKIVSVWTKGMTTIPCTATLWRWFSEILLFLWSNRHFKFSGVWMWQSRQACRETREMEGRKLGTRKHAFCRTSPQTETNDSTWPLDWLLNLQQFLLLQRKGNGLFPRAGWPQSWINNWRKERWHPLPAEVVSKISKHRFSPSGDASTLPELPRTVSLQICPVDLTQAKSKRAYNSIPLSRNTPVTEIFLLKISIFFLLSLMSNIWMMCPWAKFQVPSLFSRKRPISPHKWFSALADAATSFRFQQRGIGRAWIRAEGNWGAGADFKAGQSPAPRAELEGICCMCQMS